MDWVYETPSYLTSDGVGALETLSILPQRGFSLAPETFAHLLTASGLQELIEEKLGALRPEDPDSLMLTCFSTRSLLLKTPFPTTLSQDLSQAYERLATSVEVTEPLVTVRPRGAPSHEGGRFRGLQAIQRGVAACYAEHLTRCVMHEGMRELPAVLAQTPPLVVGHAMGWSCSGIMTTYEPRTGAEDFVVVMSTWGLAEDIARKELARDEYILHKPGLREGFASLVRRRPGHKEFRLDFDISAGRPRHNEVPHERVREFTLTPEEAVRLARAALLVESPMEIDWGMEEGWSRELHLLAARPGSPPPPRPLKVYTLGSHGPSLLQGKAVGNGLAIGTVRVIEQRSELESFQPGEVLVTRKTEPDWEPTFRRAAAIVTEADTRVSHSTILARELGIPAVLDAGGGSLFLATGQRVTVACCQGDVAHIYEGEADFTVEEFDARRLPELKAELMVSLSMPERALAESQRPWAGAGLVRSEFMLSGWVRIHPMALCFPERLPLELQGTIHRLCRGYDSKKEYFVDQMSQGVATIASAFWPRPVLLRLSDLKSHEYAKLVGGERFEPVEANPVLGFRGAARYTHPDYRPAFDLELAAIRRVRGEMGLRNLHLMVPYCRTPQEGEEVLEILSDSGLKQGQEGLQVWVMAELPGNVLQAAEFAELFDGLSIGSNDLTQLTLGLDRDNARVSSGFDEIHPVMMASYQILIDAARAAGKKVSFCGQVASDDPLFCATLAEMGINSVSITPDSFAATLSSLRC